MEQQLCRESGVMDSHCQVCGAIRAKGNYAVTNNARPHVSRVARDMIHRLHWVPLSHPPYSPDLAPTD
ncbi:hypothetical protein PR048_003588 [Dryococelus australis]|uniref:Transposase n=1 Tax=Dryococelus australis TaxID=614101 RepID=A0ABQ9INI3_9NEOP|nr:hypothetical protein PR048_003588 [Dryococelus australis]